MAWLEGLAAKHGAQEDTLYVPPEERKETPPEWVVAAAQAQETAQAGPAAEPALPEESLPPAQPAEEQPLESIAGESLEVETPLSAGAAEIEAAPEEPIQEQPVESLPDWLQELASSTQETEAGTKPEPEPAAPAGELPAWLQELQEEATEESHPEPQADATAPASPVEKLDWRVEEPETLATSPLESAQPTPGETPPVAAQGESPEEVLPVEQAGPGAPSAADQDAALAWLESLAAKHGAQEETLYVAPQDRTENPPNWVREAMEEAAPASSAPAPQEEETPALESVPSEARPPSLESEALAESALQDAAPPEVSEPLPEAQAPEAQKDTELPAWLQGFELEVAEAPQEERAPDGQSATEEIPAWLQELEKTPPSGTKISTPEAQPETLPEENVPTPAFAGTLSLYEQAQASLANGDLRTALVGYDQLIKTGQGLDEVIQDLENGARRHPSEIMLWQTLGDAYARANRLQDAIDAYTSAEDLLQ